MSSWSAWDAQSDPRLERVNDALRPVVARTGIDAVHGVTPLMEVAMLEEAEALTEDDAYEEGLVEGHRLGAVDGMRETLRIIFKDGYHPGLAARRLYCLAQRMAPELIAEMSLADLGSMFGETRQAFEARMDKVFGDSGVRGRDQKRKGAAERMAAAQMGNTNRKQGELKKRILNHKKKEK